MLVRFIVSNFMSFKEETEFNMLPASGQKRLKEHIYSAGGVEVLKMAAIYGANGAGKSNLVKAMKAMKNIIEDADFSGVVKFKLDKEFLSNPTTFEMEFEIDRKIYRYGLSIDTNTIHEEWLYESGIETDKLIFDRTTSQGQTSIAMSEDYRKHAMDEFRIKLYETELLKDNVTLLKMLSESKDGFDEIKMIYNRLGVMVTIITPSTKFTDWAEFFEIWKDIGNFINENVNLLSTGLDKLKLNTTSLDNYFAKEDRITREQIEISLKNGNNRGIRIDSAKTYPPFAFYENDKVVVKSITSIHKDKDGNDVKFELEEESDGTLRILDFLPALYAAIHLNHILIIDEIDQSIHVNLLKEIISKFSKDNNTTGQLIFTTHESNLLDQDILRQDEIWFAEKNTEGATQFYPLSDYDIRSDLDIRKGYLNGRFGAVPFLANLHDLNWDKYGKEE